MPAVRSDSGWMQPVELDQALMLLHQTPATVLAGGTDLFPSIAGAALPGPVLDLSQLQALRELSVLPAPGPSGQGTVQEYLRIGAALTWTDLLHADLPQGLEALRLAAREIGAGQIQNRATLGGNLCNASPAADSVPVLLALEAKVELRRQGGCRTLELADFILGNRRTALASGELMTAVLIPLPLAGSRSLFLKLGHRRYLVISAVSLAISACFDAQRRLSRCAVAVGACSAVAQRMRRLEQHLTGLAESDLQAMLRAPINDDWLGPINPIDDVRGSAQFRRAAAGRLILRGLAELVGQS